VKMLTYMVAFGRQYAAMARMAAHGARAHGYGGAFVVFTDHPCTVPGARTVVLEGAALEAIRNRSGKRLFRSQYGDPAANEFDWLKAKSCPDLFMDVSGYDYLLYLDCDCLVTGRLEDVTGHAGDAVLTIQQRHRSVRQGCGDLVREVPLAMIAAAERTRKSNAGVLGVPRRCIGLFRAMREGYDRFVHKGFREGSKPVNDEHVLNWLIATGAVRTVHDWRVGYSAERKGKVVYHFVGEPSRKVGPMVGTFRRLFPGAPEDISSVPT